MAIDSQWYFDWISSQMESSQTYASQAFDIATDYLGNLHDIVIGTISTTVPDITIDDPGSIILDTTIQAQLPEAPLSSDYPAPPTNSPLFSEHDFPSVPAYSIPSVPVVNDITIPTFISNDVPGITSELPLFTDNVPAISIIDSGVEASKDSLAQAISEKLELNIRNGGTMLDATIEADIWNRDLERRNQALQDQVDKIADQWSKLGWSLPNGLLSGQLTALNNEFINKNLESSRIIAVEQAKLEHDGLFKSLEMGNQFTNIFISSANDYAKRVFEASKTTAEVTISIFKERVNRYNALLLGYKTDVEAFKAKIDAEVSRAQAYKMQIDGLALVNQIDETKVKIYLGQLSAINTMVDVYKNQVQATGMMYEAEKSKIERFKVEVEAYSAQIDAVTKKYSSQVEGFKAFVAGYTASSDSQTKFADLRGRSQIAEVEARMKSWEIQADLLQKNLTIKLEALKAEAQISSNLAAGALAANHAGMNASIAGTASLSY